MPTGVDFQLRQDIVLHHEGKVFTDWGVHHFPDGQQQFWCGPKHCKGNGRRFPSLEIRITSPELLDLFWQILYTANPVDVKIMYLYGARSDKDAAGVNEVANLPKIIASQLDAVPCGGGSRVTVVAPHCTGTRDWTAAWPVLPFDPTEYDLILFPDESAYVRMGHQFKDSTTAKCQKVRDPETSNITMHQLPKITQFMKPGSRILVADDLCDGGRTFLSIADMMPKGMTLDLYVVHGVFSNGAIPKLKEKYGTIFTTNSYQDLRGEPVMQTNVWSAGV